jgi:hypothetical protein
MLTNANQENTLAQAARVAAAAAAEKVREECDHSGNFQLKTN